jgi:hypothetical protein
MMNESRYLYTDSMVGSDELLKACKKGAWVTVRYWLAQGVAVTAEMAAATKLVVQNFQGDFFVDEDVDFDEVIDADDADGFVVDDYYCPPRGRWPT